MQMTPKFNQFFLVHSCISGNILMKDPISNLVAMATPITSPYMQNTSSTKLKSVQSYFSKWGCFGNSLYSLKNLAGTFEFGDPENPSIRAKNVSMFYTELKSVQLWLIFD